jgi:hypothetical protein
MELLLNLLWLTLVVPAFLIWRRHSRAEKSFLCKSSFRGILLLGCLLVFLFPVVSATDDLHPLHNEIEESNPSRRTVKQAQTSQAPDWSGFGSPPASLVEIASFRPESSICGSVTDHLPVLPVPVFSGIRSCRAPPSS